MAEYASSARSLAALTASLSEAHPSVVRAINAKRRAMRLPEIITRGNPLAPPPRLVTASSTASRGGRPCKTSRAKWAGLKLDAAVMIGRARMNARR